GRAARSEHPSAAAIRQEAARLGLEPVPVRNVITRPSAGIVGDAGGSRPWAGNPRMAAHMGASIEHPLLKDLVEDTQTVIYAGRGSELLGAVSIADQVRPSSGPAIAALRDGGIVRTVMMTGDRRPVALRIGEELGIRANDIYADMLPEDKVRMVGD